MADPIFRNPQFDALRNALYHTERRNFLDLLNRCLNFSVIVLGAGVVSKLSDRIHFLNDFLELSVVVLATAQLVFDFGSRARTHEFLQRKYYEVLSEMERDNQDSLESRIDWSAKLLTISADEPMTMRALDAVAFNKALDALCDDKNERERYRQKINRWRYFMRNICAFHNHNFQKP